MNIIKPIFIAVLLCMIAQSAQLATLYISKTGARKNE